MRLSCSSTGLRKGAWTEEEDALLRTAIAKFGEGKWHKIPARAGLNRCRKSCRLRWLNYLRPDIKRGDFSADEIDLMLRLHKLLGNRWSLIAGRLPGRTANDVKNYWNTHLFKKSVAGIKPDAKKPRPGKNVSNTQVSVIKPKPMPFTNVSTVNWMNREGKESAGTGAPVGDVAPPAPAVQFEKEGCGGANSTMQFWLDNLFCDSDGDQGKGGTCSTAAVPVGDILMLSPAGAGGGVSADLQGGAVAPYSNFFPVESELWDLLLSD